MAKQRGIHQLSGTVNNMVYYSKKGTNTGVARRQNEAMSSRLKEGPEFANTRVTNSAFGACMMFASIFLNFSHNRDLYLKGANRAGKLAASILEMAKVDKTNWDEGNIDPISWPSDYLLRALNGLVKNNLRRFFPSFPYSYSDITIGDTLTLEFGEINLENYVQETNADGLEIQYIGMSAVYGSSRDITTGKYTAPEVVNPPDFISWGWKKGDGEFSVGVEVNGTDDARSIFFIGVVPFRLDGSENKTYLKEFASSCFCIPHII